MRNQEFSNNPYGLKRWHGIVNYMTSEDWSSKLPATIEYLESCDKQRGTDFRTIFTELDGEL
jgi:hypothetical protein